VEVDIELAREAIYWRGLFINRYAAVEYAVADLVSRASLHHAYVNLGHPPFGPTFRIGTGWLVTGDSIHSRRGLGVYLKRSNSSRKIRRGIALFACKETELEYKRS
jgi:hypothetical protein